MSRPTTDDPNADQVEYWDGEAGRGWADRDKQMEQTLGPIGALAIEAASVQTGEHVLDVGCGCAHTSFAMLEKTGEKGRVLGVDISGPMLAIAARAAKELPQSLQKAIAFEKADASVYPFEEASFDLAFSRFGVMFFADPVLAFTNIRKALKPTGRLTFICWAPVPGNDWITIPMSAALQHVAPPEPMPPNAPGPFGLSDPEYVKGVLAQAGYGNIEVASVTPTMRFGHDMPADRIGDSFLEVGPVSRLLADASAEQTNAVRASVYDAIKPYYDGKTVNLGASCWIVTASN
jgi:SAM-dependent methyltransferase